MEPNNVILPEVRPILHFDNVQGFRAGIFKTMGSFDGNGGALPDLQMQHIVAAGYAAHAEGRALETSHVLAELTGTRPLAVVRAEKVQALRLWAEERTVPTD